MKALDRLRSIDFSSANPEEIRAILSETSVLIVPFIIPKGSYILRARKGGYFTKRSEMTYCPVKYCTLLQRASLKGQTMFYGVISDDQSHLENARVISACECSELCREGRESIGKESFTVSHWEVIKPLRVVSLITDTTFPEVTNNRLLNQMRDAFKQIHGQQNSIKEEKELAYFINSEFSKIVTSSSEYLISATIASDIVSTPEFDAIVFPSVQLGGQAGLNIAISPTVVNKKLRFIRTLSQTLYKNKGKSIIRIEKATERGKKTRDVSNITDSFIENDIGIKSIADLPFKS